MIWKAWISTLALFALAVTWTGCETDGPHGTFVCTADEIRTGDTLIVSLLDIPPEQQLTEKQFVVRNDGAVNLPFIGSMKAAGKKFGEFERQVQTTYITKKIFNQVTVVVKAGDRFYTVDGEVKGPSRQPYIGETTVIRAIASCGGFTEFANRRKVKVLRGTGETEIVDCKKAAENPKKFDRTICPGDVIIVPRSL